MISLSTIIIGRNSEKTLPTCIISVQNALQNFNDGITNEFIYVDSISSDKSVSIAKTMNCKIIEIESGFISAALGRKLGLEEATGEYLLFLDADMELHPEWLNECMHHLIEYKAIIGERHEMIYSKDILVNEILNFNNIKEIRPLKIPGGFLMIERALANSASFHPLCKTEEEGDFYAQFIDRKKIMALPVNAYKHHNYKSINDKLKHHLQPFSSISYLYSLYLSLKESYFFSGYSKIQKHHLINICSGLVFWIGLLSFSPILLLLWFIMVFLNGKIRIKGSIVSSILLPYKVVSALIFYSKSYSSQIRKNGVQYTIEH